MKSWFKGILFAAVTAVTSFLFADPTPNYWQAVDGSYDGKWSDVRHWSLGHLPTTGEYARFDAWTQEGKPNKWIDYSVEIDGDYTADLLWVGINNSDSLEGITFIGSGSVTFEGQSYDSGSVLLQQSLRQILHGVTFDGPSFDLQKGSILLYCPITVKNGSVVKLLGVNLWYDTARLYVHDGGTLDVAGSIGYAYTPDPMADSVTVEKGGTLKVSGSIAEGNSEYAARPFRMTINGGTASVGAVNFTRGTELLKVSGDTARVSFGTVPTLRSVDQIQLEGGFVDFNHDAYCDGDTIVSRALTNKNLKGVSCNVVCKTGPDPVVSSAPLVTAQFRNMDQTANAEQHINVRDLTFRGGETFPFYWYQNRLNRIYGPITVHALSDMTHSGCNAYLFCYGKMTLDTRDPTDPTQTHKIYLRGITSGNGSLELTVTGGGTAQVDPYHSENTIDTVSVEEGTTLELGDCYLGGYQGEVDLEWKRFIADSFALGENATLKFNAKAQSVQAANWDIDPTARIVISAPTDVDYGAFPILQDLESKDLPDAWLSQITVTGNEQGLWQLRNEFGQITLYRDYPDGTLSGYNWEWKGGVDEKFSTVANWATTVGRDYMDAGDGPHYFGASKNRRIHANGGMYRAAAVPPDYLGANINSWIFLATATGSYFLYGGVQYNLYAPISNNSALPQVLGTSLRWNEPQLYAQGFGPIVISGEDGQGGRNENFSLDGEYDMYVKGDIRFGSTFTHPRIGLFFNCGYPAQFSGFTVTPGGSMTFSKQGGDLNLSRTGTFRVAKDATLTFAQNDAAGARYRITACAGSFFVNGTMNINAPFYGGVDQAYRGKGTLNIATTRSGSTSSKVEFGGKLTVNSTVWNTVTADNTDAAVAIGVRGTPTLKVADGWTYGPAAGVTPSAPAEARALSVEASSTLTVDPNGGTATFAEKVVGEGVLAVANGSVLLNGGMAAETTLAIAAGGVYSVSGDQTLAGSLVGAGGTLAFTLPATLNVGGDVNLSGLTVQIGVSEVTTWQTLIVCAGEMTGTPVLPEGWKYRIVEQNGQKLLQAKPILGLSVILR